MAKKKVVKDDEPKYTDIKREYFFEDGVEKVKQTYLNGSKVVKEDVVNS